METQTKQSNPKIQTSNPLRGLADHGQSVWLDYIRRNLITSGELKRMVDEDGLRGVTSNPAIFEKAIAGSSDYKEALHILSQEKGLDAKAVYERLATQDIQLAASVMEPVYQKTKRRDGYVSLEVSPYLAHDTAGTVKEARRLWKTVNRENVMIKVPATPEGIPAIEQLISEGINVNVTLIFSRDVYEQVAGAYISGLEKLASGKGDLGKVASVASFFVSRIDSAIDTQIGECSSKEKTSESRAHVKCLCGKAAIANAKLAYARYKEFFTHERWQALQKKGAQTQRLLWASTGTKNPEYSDVLYVEELIGTDTVNTIPPATYDAFKSHGRLRPSLEENEADAYMALRTLQNLGISFKEITDQLLEDGLEQFSKAFDALLCAVESAYRSSSRGLIKNQTYKLPQDLEKKVELALKDWQAKGETKRLWARDAALWTGSDENNWLGWLGLTEDHGIHARELAAFAEKIKSEKFTHILLLGMGGSSLCPDVLKKSFGKIGGWPELHVLDSTDPAQIANIEKKINLERTLFIVSSKSGSTLEPNIFKAYFFERVKKIVGAEKAGLHFIAITDPKSKLQEAAECDNFRHIFFGLPSVGGRFSALSDFGMVPAALMGIDVEKFMERADEMVHACTSCVPAAENPAVVLGVILGVLGNHGCDKVTLVTSPKILDLGAWLEQLLAESTGKEGKGLIPIDTETPGKPEVYGKDRMFVYTRLESKPDGAQDTAVERLEKAGFPVVRISVRDAHDLGQEFFRWEVATAVAGSILGINPFNQPDVEASKIATRDLTSEYERQGFLPKESPIFEDGFADGGIYLFADERNASYLVKTVGNCSTLACYLQAHLGQLQAGDYFGLLAYLEMNEANEDLLQEIRLMIRNQKHAATCLGFGPRFLHSTGQAYKGGPDSGVFLQITCEDAKDLAIPGQKYTFGVVKAAQARGDFQVLAERGRRVLRVHLGENTIGGLQKLKNDIKTALNS